MQGDITVANIEKLERQQKAAGKTLFLWDKSLPGFGAKALPSGKIAYIAQYRLGGRGKPTRRLALGNHGELTPAEARDKAKKALARAHDGNDPAIERQQNREAKTFRQIAERYLTDYAEAKKKPRSVEEDKRNLKKHIYPVLGSTKITDIGSDEIEKLHAGMKTMKTTANRCLSLVSHIITKAMKWKERPQAENPCRFVERYRETQRKRYLSSDELVRMGDALMASEEKEHPSGIGMLRLLVLSGARLDEIRTLKWEYIKGPRLELPDSKTDTKTIPLGAPALALLDTLTKEEGNPYVFPGRKEGEHFIGVQKVWQRVRRRAKLTDVRIHDLRHSFASVSIAIDPSLPLLGKILGHKSVLTTQRYAHLADDPARAAANRASGKIAAALAGKPKRQRKKNVVSLAEARKRNA